MKKWKRTALGDDGLLLIVQSGYACGRKDVANGVPHLRMNNVSKDGRLDMALIRRVPHEIAKKQNRFLTRGDVIFTNTNSTALVGKTCVFDGWDEPCAFSNHLTQLRPNPDRLISEWLFLCLHDLRLRGFFATNCTEFIGQSAFMKDALLAVNIPIPPLAEQRRIVARVEALTDRSQKLSGLNSSLVEDMTRLLRAEYKRITEGAPTKPFSDVAKLVRRWVKTKPDQNYPETGIRSFGKGTFRKPALTGEQLGTKRICRIKAGDLVFMNVFAWEGAIAVAQPEDDGRVASHRFMMHEVLPDQATAEFLCYYFLTERGLEQIRGASPGSAGRNRTLGITKLEKIPVPMPPIEDQRRFAKLRKLHFQLQRLHQEAEAELASFTPALLAKAFRGEL
jgi:type I restriction enzyme, S subunit